MAGTRRIWSVALITPGGSTKPEDATGPFHLTLAAAREVLKAERYEHPPSQWIGIYEWEAPYSREAVALLCEGWTLLDEQLTALGATWALVATTTGVAPPAVDPVHGPLLGSML